MSDHNEKIITPYIPAQFPAIYREDYPIFVEFLKMYYAWLQLETQAVGKSKRLSDYRDIDRTLDDYIVYFKNKYLPLLKFDSATDKRTLVKHILDLYRSKGTDRGIDLFFKLVYAQPAEVYYPATDLFRLSDNKYVKKQYLELGYNPLNVTYPGRKITGLSSGATAFAEKYVIKKKGDYAYVLFISNIVGDFITGERILHDDMEDLVAEELPRIVGSLNTLDITSGSQGFQVGDLVDLVSERGAGGVARVADISDITGLVDFELRDGGWGYTSYANVFISEKVIGLSNVQFDTTTNNPDNSRWSNNGLFRLESVSQPLYRLDYTSATNTISEGALLNSYHPNNAVRSTVKVLSVTTTNTTAGNLFVYVTAGTPTNTTFYTSANADSVSVQNANNKTAVGNVVGVSSNQTLHVSNASVRFLANNFVYQLDNKSRVVARGYIKSTSYVGLSGTIAVINATGTFKTSSNLFLQYANGQFTNSANYLNTLDLSVGLANIQNDFVTTYNMGVTAVTSNSTANITSISQGALASFDVSNLFSYADSYALYTDVLDNNTILTTVLNATSYGFSKLPAANLNSDPLDDVFSFVSGNVGTIQKLVNVNPGKNYDSAPQVFVYDPYISGFGKKDYIITYTNATKNFTVGEVITQDNGAKGRIKSVVNATALSVSRQSILVDFDPNAANSSFEGISSGAIADLVLVAPDELSQVIGENADITANVQTGTGVVTSLEVIGSGYGYRDDETVDFISEDGLRAGTAKANLIKQGTARGVYNDESSFVSANKYLFDGDYYQEFSYDIKSGIVRDKFEANYNQTMHLAGTKMFATFVHTSSNPKNTNILLPELTANTSA